MPATPTQADFAGQPIWFTQEGITPNAEVELTILVESLHYAADFVALPPVRRHANAAGLVHFRLDPLLRPLLSPPLPVVEAGPITRLLRSSARNYFVRTAEVAADGSLGTLQESSVRAVLRGAVPASFTGNYFAWREALTGRVPFLTWRLGGGELLQGQPAWLVWCAGSTTPQQLTIRRRYVRRTDAGNLVTRTAEENFTLESPTAYRVISIPVKPGLFNAFRMDITILNSDGDAVSEVYSFAINRTAPPRSRSYFFENSVGGLDALLTTGRVEDLRDGKQETAMTPALPVATSARATVVDLALSRRVKVATGWLPETQRAWLTELVYSPAVWESVSETSAEAIVLTKRALTLYPDDDLLARGAVFEYEPSVPERTYANFGRTIISNAPIGAGG